MRKLSPFRYGWLLAVAWIALSLQGPAWGAGTGVAAGEEKMIRAVVQAQLDAFAADDAGRAFSYAAPNIRKMMGSAENFMAMVRAGYPAVYRPAAVLFLKPESGDGGDVVQRLQLTDAHGDTWLATYTMQRQKDKRWRIAGCTLQPHTGRMA